MLLSALRVLSATPRHDARPLQYRLCLIGLQDSEASHRFEGCLCLTTAGAKDMHDLDHAGGHDPFRRDSQGSPAPRDFPVRLLWQTILLRPNHLA